MKDFQDFKNYMHADGSYVHDEIVAEVNRLIEKAKISDPIEEQVFYYRAFSETSVMKVLERYHEWLGKE